MVLVCGRYIIHSDHNFKELSIYIIHVIYYWNRNRPASSHKKFTNLDVLWQGSGWGY